jgi:hypothetical protein
MTNGATREGGVNALHEVADAASERTSRHEDAMLSELRAVKQALFILCALVGGLLFGVLYR